MIKRISTSVLMTAAIATSAFAANEDQVFIHSEIVQTPSDAFSKIANLSIESQVSFDEPSTGAGLDYDAILNLGQQAWEVIKANAPVLTTAHTYANALPAGVRSGAELENFSGIQTKAVRIWATNIYGMTLYDITLMAVHQYNGSLDGKGKYLEAVSIVPLDVHVSWGYTVDVNVNSASTVNFGTKADPVAGIVLEASMKANSVLHASERRIVYEFHGDSPEVKIIGL